jgi:hypothetical protein
MQLLHILLGAVVPITSLDQLTSLGTAGVMGAMWLWERRTSRQREQQIDEAHARIMSDRVLLDELLDVVRQNTAAITTLTQLSTCHFQRSTFNQQEKRA